MIPMHYLRGYLRGEIVKPRDLKQMCKREHTFKGEYFPGDYLLVSSIYFDGMGKLHSIADGRPVTKNSLMYFKTVLKDLGNSSGSYTVRNFLTLLKIDTRTRYNNYNNTFHPSWLKIKFNSVNYKIGGDMNLIVVKNMTASDQDRSRILCAVAIKKDTATGKFPDQGNCERNIVLLRSEYYNRNRGLAKKLDEFYEGMQTVDMAEASIYKALFTKTTYSYPSNNLSENLNYIEDINKSITDLMVINADNEETGARFISNRLNTSNPQIHDASKRYAVNRAITLRTINSFLGEAPPEVAEPMVMPTSILEQHMASVMNEAEPVGQVYVTGTAGPIDGPQRVQGERPPGQFFTPEYFMGTDPITGGGDGPVFTRHEGPDGTVVDIVHNPLLDTPRAEASAGQLSIEELARMAEEL